MDDFKLLFLLEKCGKWLQTKSAPPSQRPRSSPRKKWDDPLRWWERPLRILLGSYVMDISVYFCSLIPGFQKVLINAITLCPKSNLLVPKAYMMFTPVEQLLKVKFSIVYFFLNKLQSHVAKMWFCALLRSSSSTLLHSCFEIST